MSTDSPVLDPDEDFTNIPNLAANALPITPLLVAMIEYVHRARLTRMRLRDAWVSESVAGPTVQFAIAMGGDLRGGENGALWGGVRMHPLYMADQDLKVLETEPMMKNWAMIQFLVPGPLRKAIDRLILVNPVVTEDPLVKYRTAAARTQAKYPEVDQKRLGNLLRTIATLVETLRAPRPTGT